MTVLIASRVSPATHERPERDRSEFPCWRGLCPIAPPVSGPGPHEILPVQVDPRTALALKLHVRLSKERGVEHTPALAMVGGRLPIPVNGEPAVAEFPEN